MKIWQSLVLMVLATLLYSCSYAPEALDSNGRPVNIADFKGKWVVINYWTTWCNSCVKELPTLNTLASHYPDKVVVLGVNADNLSDQVLRSLARNYQIHYRFLRIFPIEKWRVKLSRQLPVTYILDPNGKLSQTIHGPVTLENLQAIMHLPNLTYD